MIEARAALAYVGQAGNESLEVKRFDPEDLSPVYNRSEDTFPRPSRDSGVIRYDFRRPPLPAVSAAAGSGAGGQGAYPAAKHFRRMAVYVKDGLIIQVREAIDLQGNDDRQNQVATEKTVTTLTLPAPDAMAMCMQVTPEAVAQMQLAFDGTVSAISGDEVTLDVAKWYVGGDTDQVRLTQLGQPEMIALEGGIQLEQGQRYLVTAHEGVVNGCGFTAQWSQDLQDIFDQAFPA